MADENVTLEFLAEQGRRILDELLEARTEREIVRGDNRRVLGELASNRATMAGLTTEMTVMRGDLATLRTTLDAILTELREMRVQNASFDNRLRRLEEDAECPLMATVTKRHWKTAGGVERAAWIVSYSAAGKRHIKTFQSKREADDWNDGWSPKRVQIVMGHSSIGVTFDVYGHLMPDPEADVTAMQRLQTRLIG